jgi:transcription elongation factor Elf1
MLRSATVLLATLILLAGSACGGAPEQPITKLVEPVDVKTGWFDAGVENGMNKLVPSATLSTAQQSAVSRWPTCNSMR